MDTSEYARFERPGHRLTGDRSSQDRRHRDGVDVVHAIVDDHSRLAYAEIHSDAKAPTVLGFLERALAFYATHGISVRRLMTDNAWAYTRSRLVRELLARSQIRHLTIKPHRPRTNGKVERFHLSRTGFSGDLGTRMLSWGEEILRCHVQTEEVPRGVARAWRSAGA
jgi:transposase InsO family protein